MKTTLSCIALIIVFLIINVFSFDFMMNTGLRELSRVKYMVGSLSQPFVLYALIIFFTITTAISNVIVLRKVQLFSIGNFLKFSLIDCLLIPAGILIRILFYNAGHSDYVPLSKLLDPSLFIFMFIIKTILFSFWAKRKMEREGNADKP